MGDPPAHRPLTQAKLLYDAEALSVRFRVDDCFVVALETESQSGVSADSGVELFFVPGEEVSPGYFNIEVNCVGTTLFHHQRDPGIERTSLDEPIDSLKMRHSIPGPTVDPEVPGPITWTIGYRVPFALVQPDAQLSPPVAGDVWRANLYKCAGRSSPPHWLTWSPMVYERPNFHLKHQFGILHFP